MFAKTMYLASLALQGAGYGSFTMTNDCHYQSVTVYYGSEVAIETLSAGSKGAKHPAIHRDDGADTVLNAVFSGSPDTEASVVINTPGDDKGQIILNDFHEPF